MVIKRLAETVRELAITWFNKKIILNIKFNMQLHKTNINSGMKKKSKKKKRKAAYPIGQSYKDKSSRKTDLLQKKKKVDVGLFAATEKQ